MAPSGVRVPGSAHVYCGLWNLDCEDTSQHHRGLCAEMEHSQHMAYHSAGSDIEISAERGSLPSYKEKSRSEGKDDVKKQNMQ